MQDESGPVSVYCASQAHGTTNSRTLNTGQLLDYLIIFYYTSPVFVALQGIGRLEMKLMCCCVSHRTVAVLGAGLMGAGIAQVGPAL